jgi:toxin CcdB
VAQFDLRALAHYAAPVPVRSLRQMVGNLSSQSHLLIAAMDVVLSGI